MNFEVPFLKFCDSTLCFKLVALYRVFAVSKKLPDSSKSTNTIIYAANNYLLKGTPANSPYFSVNGRNTSFLKQRR